MDFHSLSRKELQALCKNNKIPANMTNVAMADALNALQHVEGLEELLNPSDSDLSKPAEETLTGSPGIPRTACRTSTRRKPIKEEPKSTQPLSCTRRGTRGKTAEDIDEENKDVNVPITPAAPSGRRRAPAASASRNIETQMREDEKNEAKGRSAVPSSRGRPPVASARRKLEPKKEDNSVQRVYSTRRSVRLLENSMAKLSMMEKGNAEPEKIERDLFEEMTNSSERSEVSVEVEKNIHEVGSEKTDDDVNVLKSEEALGSEISDNLGVVKVSEAVDEAHDEGSDESDVILSEKMEKAIDVDDETVEKGPADVSVTVQDDGAEDSLAIKASSDVFAEVKDHVVASQSLEPNLQSQSSSDVQDENPQDSHMNVAVDDDLGSHYSESEYTTEGESDEDSDSDANSSECHEKNPEAPVLPVDQMVGFEKLESKMEESDQLVTKFDTTIDNDSGSEHSEIDSVDFAEKESLNDDCVVDVYMNETEEVAVKINDHTLAEIPKFMKNMSPGLVISDSEVTLSTVATDSLSEDKSLCRTEDPMAKVQESSESETLVDVCVMPAHECPPSLAKTPTSVKKTCHLISQPFAADQISGQFPRPTQLTQKKSSAIKQSIQKITDVSYNDEEDLDNGNGKLELDKDKARQDENTIDGDITGFSLTQLRKELKKKMQITHNRKNNKDKTAIEEQVGMKRIALQPLPKNCMDVDKSEK